MSPFSYFDSNLCLDSTDTIPKGSLRTCLKSTGRHQQQYFFFSHNEQFSRLLDEAYRVQFLKDFVFNKLVENEEANGFLIAMIRSYQYAIIRDIDSDKSHYDTFQKRLESCVDEEGKKNVLGFLREFFLLAKAVISPEHFNFYQ